MNGGLRISVPVKITEAMLSGTDVPEADYATWASGTTYAIKARCIKGHVIWESLKDSNTGNDPEAAGSGWWTKVSATNRWRLFDLEQVTRTSSPGNMFYELEPGAPIDSVHILGMDNVDSAQVRIYDGATLVKDFGQNAAGLLPTASDWWAYCYGPWTLSDQQHYRGLPYIVDPKIRVDFAGSSQSVQVLILGNDTTFGNEIGEGVLGGVRFRSDQVVAFSDENFNIPTMETGALVDTVTFTLQIKSSKVDELRDFHKDNARKVCFFTISDRWRTTQVLGKITSFEALLHGPTISEFAFEIRGVPQQ
ncbi:MAG: hypothetical protein WBC18_14855 [Ottowia sp.]|uniref:hypothetical protein n=1 Tax=Ottowia sp. TaxID=1898956 RepID=UPI003C7616BD